MSDSPEYESGDEVSAQDSPQANESSRKTGRELSIAGFLPSMGFTSSLLPRMDSIVAKMLVPMQAQIKAISPDLSAYARDIMEPVSVRLQEQMKAVLPDYDAIVKSVLKPYNEQYLSQMPSIITRFPTFTVPRLDHFVFKDIGISPATESMLKQVVGEQSKTLEGLRGSLRPLFDPEIFRGINRAFLPANLRDYADEVNAIDVHRFLEEEGIPLYLVPRGRTALRLVRAPDRASRRKVLGDCYESIIDDCTAVLLAVDAPRVGDSVEFALDAVGAMRSGHASSAQAMLTVTLDTLIYRFYPNKKERGTITNRAKGVGVPDAFDQMGVHEAMVWLPIWNAHEMFWNHEGDVVPRHYSRHASVHGVSARQFSKRNCVQVLMLVTSLIGYAERFTLQAD